MEETIPETVPTRPTTFPAHCMSQDVVQNGLCPQCAVTVLADTKAFSMKLQAFLDPKIIQRLSYKQRVRLETALKLADRERGQ